MKNGNLLKNKPPFPSAIYASDRLECGDDTRINNILKMENSRNFFTCILGNLCL
ncbi:hypothetical protein P22_1322 [Propionispora sp. 2/2-37]|nr:hypothetical protein P22_1322 [Propionispora sp. 2/2-37]